PLIGRERLAEGLADFRVTDRFIDTILRRAEAGRGLTDAVLVKEMLHHLQAPPLFPENRRMWHTDIFKDDMRVICRHVEGPEIFLHREAGRARRHEEAGDAETVPRLAGRAGEDQVMACLVDAGVPRLFAVDDPL